MCRTQDHMAASWLRADTSTFPAVCARQLGSQPGMWFAESLLCCVRCSAAQGKGNQGLPCASAPVLPCLNRGTGAERLQSRQGSGHANHTAAATRHAITLSPALPPQACSCCPQACMHCRHLPHHLKPAAAALRHACMHCHPLLRNPMAAAALKPAAAGARRPVVLFPYFCTQPFPK